jgi:hypothetical protein
MTYYVYLTDESGEIITDESGALIYVDTYPKNPNPWRKTAKPTTDWEDA